jgi:hypothetical protein
MCRRSGVPPLTSHDSHAGYLTSTSPEIKAAAVPPSPATQLSSPSPKSKRFLSKSLTMPASRSPSASPVRPGTSADVRKSITSLFGSETPDTEDKKSSRSSSPIKKPKETSPQKGTGTIAARRLSRGSETAGLPSIQIDSDAMNGANNSVPSIVTIPETPPFDGTRDPPKTTHIPQQSFDSKESLLNKIVPRTSIPSSLLKNPNVVTSPSGNMISHRRIRSDSGTPSKLSYSMTAPLSPLEEARTPAASRNPSGVGTGGFFSSVFSVAQNAANTLTNSLGNNTTKSKATLSQPGSQEVLPDSQNGDTAAQDKVADKDQLESSKPLAIETIGSGDLSLSHLGIIADTQSTTGTVSPSAGNGEADVGRSRSSTVVHKEDANTRDEGLSAARAVSAAYASPTGPLSATTPVAEDVAEHAPLPSSIPESVSGEDKTPINGSMQENDTSSLLRSGSIRSKVERRKKRQRNSSGATTIGAAIAASHSMLNMPSTSSLSKITGFAVANKKRNKDFHNFFRSVPEDDYLIEDYSCALQRDIILAGRIYISEGHICFSSNILGWVTNLVISFDEVVSVEKESTAMLFANAIAIQTLHARHTFRSLLSRDATYDLIINIWRINHPNLESSENGVRLASGTGSKTTKVDMEGSDDGSEGSDISGDESDDQENGYGSDESGSFLNTREGSVAGSEPVDVKNSAARRTPTMLGLVSGQAASSIPTVTENRAAEKAGSAAAALGDFPGPSTHGPTECTDQASHYDKLLKDEVIPAPLGKVYSMVFGAASGGFMSRWLVDEVKVTDLQFEDDKKGLTEEKKSRSYTYVKPLNGAIGPRTTKCVITEQLDHYDLDRSVSVTVTTQTPDVPSGNLFSTKTRYCFMWGPNNSTRIIMCFTLEWTGKSWIKG